MCENIPEGQDRFHFTEVGRNCTTEAGISAASMSVASSPAPMICVMNETQHSAPHRGLVLRRLIAVINVEMYCTEKHKRNQLNPQVT